MKKSTANHMHRKRRKNNLTWLFALLGILVLFLGTILAFLIFSNLSSKPTETVQEVSAVNVEKDIPETDMGDLIYHEPAAENVVMQGGFGYVNNELLVTLDSSDSLSALKDYLRTIGGEVVGEIPVTADYQILLPAAHTQEELEQMIENQKKLVKQMFEGGVSATVQLEDWKKSLEIKELDRTLLALTVDKIYIYENKQIKIHIRYQDMIEKMKVIRRFYAEHRTECRKEAR
mgnify:CR=1 FL=1